MFSKALALVSFTLVGGTIAVVGCSSSSSGTGGTGDDTTPDSSTAVDAKADHVTTADSAPTPDTGASDTSTTTTCSSEPIPADAGAFMGTLPVLAIMNGDGGVAAACSSGDIESYLNDCLSASGSVAACAMWGTGGSTADKVACGNCLGENSSGTGALIGFYANEPDLVQPNSIACILATDPSSTGMACAQALLNLNFCESASCSSCTNDGMGGGNDPDGTLVGTCGQNADTGACSSYFAAYQSACTDLAGDGAASLCNGDNYTGATAFQEAFKAFGTLLCGGS